MVAQIGGTEATWCEPNQDDSVPEWVDARIGKAQPGGALTACGDRAVDGLEGVLSEHAVVGQTFDLEEPPVGFKAT
jgi:hypothetical protein